MPDFDENNSTNNEWDLDWDEFWDQESVLEEKTKSRSTSLQSILKSTTNVKQAPEKNPQNILEQVFEDEFEDDDSETKINWGVIDDVKPTNLNERVKTFLNNPFSVVIETQKKREREASILPKIFTKQKPEINPEAIESTDEAKKDEPKQRSRLTSSRITPIIDEPRQRGEKKISSIETSLSFNNLNKVARSELNDVNRLLEGSLGRLDKVKFDKEVVHDKNINYAAEEKAQSRKRDTAKIQLKGEEEEKSSEIKAETTGKTDLPILPDMTDIRFDLQKASETSQLFSQNEIQQALGRIPIEKARLQKEKIELGLDASAKQDTKNIGDALFGADGAATDESANTTDDLLDSLLDEIDGEIGGSSYDAFEPSDATIDESLGKDEIITEENIIDDNAEAALEFMDSAAMEAESLFEDFFKQGTENKDKKEVAKFGYKDVLAAKLKELKKLYELCVRFIKDPKYFLEYFKLTVKDIYIGIGVIFTFLTLSGILHLRYLTEKFPMNLF